jgi:V/A-type H+-transporting ATPase subunit I
MIVPMQKYAFLAHRDDFGEFLRELRQLGAVHVREKDTPVEEPSEELKRDQKDLDAAIRLLQRREVKEGASATLPRDEGMDLARHIIQLQEEQDALKNQLQLMQRALNELEPWGGFSNETLKALYTAGWEVSLYTCPSRKFQPEWEKDHYLWIISTVPPTLYFAVVHRAGDKPAIDAEDMSWPELDPAALREKIAGQQHKVAQLEKTLCSYQAQGLPLLREAMLEWQEKYDWKHILSHTSKEVEDALMVLEGFVPVSKEEGLKALCERSDIVYFRENPDPTDQPPVLLKNNRFSKLFEPIGSLFSLPAYQELDLTPFFAPFFMLFFGFCLGDAGYGLVALVGATFYKRKAAADWKPILTLIQFLGLSTILMGLFTGTFFGLSLLEEEFAWLGGIRNLMIDSNQAFNVALILGVVQILVGLAVQAANRIKQFGFQYAIPIFGWIVLLISLIDIGLAKAFAPFSTYAAWAGVAMIVLFSDPKAGIFGRIGKGLWDLYGITGFFGDLLSYIRLFALGISSAILGFVINDIALQMKGVAPVIGPVLFVLFLVVGHGANLLIAALGSFVHPMRLTFVEFYKNAGFVGGGKPYAPFAPRRKESSNQQK